MANARQLIEDLYSKDLASKSPVEDNALQVASQEAKEIFLTSELYDSSEMSEWLGSHLPYNIDFSPTKEDGTWSLEFTQDVPIAWIGTGDSDIGFAKQVLSVSSLGADFAISSVSIELVLDENVAVVTISTYGGKNI